MRVKSRKPPAENFSTSERVTSANSSAVPTKASTRPDAVDGLAQLLQVVLGDQLAADVATLAAVPSQWNLPPLSPAPAAVAYLSDTAPGTLILSEASS